MRGRVRVKFQSWNNSAGRVTLGIRVRPWWIYLHVLPRTADARQWGYSQDWYDGPLYAFGLGALMLICWHEQHDPIDA
jgi:hypothetical protein